MNFLKNLDIYLQSAPHFAYLVALIGGIFTSFTPCVYPLLPILVGYIGGGRYGKLKSFFISLFYVIGMAVTYAMLGAIAALTGKLFGEIQSNPWVYLAVGSIIILMGLSMLGVFTIRPLSFLRGLNKRRENKGGILGSFFLGLFSGFVAAPCTAAVLGVILTYVATRQNILFGVTLLFVFAVGSGILLLIAGTFTGFLLALPKAGKWTNVIEKIFGWCMIILGEYFLVKAGMLFV